MPPIVAKVVHVDHRFAFGPQNTADRQPAFVNDLDISLKSIIIRHAPIQPILFPLVQVAVSPTENRLESVVEAAQGYRAWNLDTPPDGWLDAKKRDLQFVDGRLNLRGGHHGYCRLRSGNNACVPLSRLHLSGRSPSPIHSGSCSIPRPTLYSGSRHRY